MPIEILEWGINLILFFQGLGDWLIGPMNLFTLTGNLEFYLLVPPAIYWCYDNRLGFRLAIIVMLSIGLNGILKIAIHDPRPYWADPRVRLLGGAETSFGIPSGHSQNTVVVWGIFGAYFKKAWVWTLLIIFMILVGLSRMYLGVHFPTDVFVGWALGILLLFLFLRFETAFTVWFQQQGRYQQVAMVFVTSVIFILIAGGVSRSVGNTFQLPPDWVENVAKITPDDPIEAFSLDDIIIGAAAFFGLVSGVILINPLNGFDAGGHWASRVGRYAVGIFGVIILWRGLGVLFSLLAVNESLFGYMLRYIRYTLIGAWVSAIGPLVFIRLGLAKAAGD